MTLLCRSCPRQQHHLNALKKTTEADKGVVSFRYLLPTRPLHINTVEPFMFFQVFWRFASKSAAIYKSENPSLCSVSLTAVKYGPYCKLPVHGETLRLACHEPPRSLQRERISGVLLHIFVQTERSRDVCLSPFMCVSVCAKKKKKERSPTMYSKGSSLSPLMIPSRLNGAS